MKSIQYKLLIGFLISILLATLVAGISIYIELSDEVFELYDLHLKEVGELFPDYIPVESLLADDEPEDAITVQIWDDKKKLLYTSNTDLQLPYPTTTGFSTVRVLNAPWRLYSKLNTNQRIQVAQPLSAMEEETTRSVIKGLTPFLISTPILLLLIIFIIKRSFNPLHKIADSLKEQTAYALQKLPDENIPTEIQPLVNAFNDLLVRLDKSMAFQRHFIDDAAHELRSPITALKIHAQLAERTETEEQTINAFTKLQTIIDRISHLVDQLLTLSRFDQIEQPQAVIDVDLNELTQQSINEYHVLAVNNRLEISFIKPSGTCVIQGNYDALLILMNNLLSNAIKFSFESSQIVITLTHTGKQMIWQITNHGPGLSDEEKIRVFDRFYRSTQTSVGGSGLGLSIVKNIADLYNVEVILSDPPYRTGLTVSLFFNTL